MIEFRYAASAVAASSEDDTGGGGNDIEFGTAGDVDDAVPAGGFGRARFRSGSPGSVVLAANMVDVEDEDEDDS